MVLLLPVPLHPRHFPGTFSAAHCVHAFPGLGRSHHSQHLRPRPPQLRQSPCIVPSVHVWQSTEPPPPHREHFRGFGLPQLGAIATSAHAIAAARKHARVIIPLQRPAVE